MNDLEKAVAEALEAAKAVDSYDQGEIIAPVDTFIEVLGQNGYMVVRMPK